MALRSPDEQWSLEGAKSEELTVLRNHEPAEREKLKVTGMESPSGHRWRSDMKLRSCSEREPSDAL